MPLKGGNKLQYKLTNIARVASGGKKVRVGILRGDNYPDGTPVATVAAVQEYGSPLHGIPSRPFMRNTVAAHSSEWPVTMGNLLKTNAYDARKTLNQMGQVVVKQLQETILEGDFVPLAPSTVERKGHATILIDSERLIKSFKYQIE